MANWSSSKLIAVAAMIGLIGGGSAFSKERVDEGFLCISDSFSKNLSAIIEAARSHGASIKPFKSRACSSSAGVEVPIGLEAWTRSLLARLGYQADYDYGTSGGSGPIEDTARDSSWFFSEAITPGSINRLGSEVFCKIKARLKPYYAEIEDNVCGKEGFKTGLCRYFCLEDMCRILLD
jgi:hypothetical protein